MSLLTQFYPGPGGGSGGSSGVFGGFDAGSARSSFVITLKVNGQIPTITGGLTGGSSWFGSRSGRYIGSIAITTATREPIYTTLDQFSPLTFTNGGDIESITFFNLSTSGNFLSVGGATTVTGLAAGTSAPWSSGISSSSGTCSFVDCSFTMAGGGLGISGAADVSTCTFRGNGGNFTASNALNAASVNQILESFAANLSFGFPTAINLANGTNAGTSSLTAAGITARNALQAAGTTITLNA